MTHAPRSRLAAWVARMLGAEAPIPMPPRADSPLGWVARAEDVRRLQQERTATSTQEPEMWLSDHFSLLEMTVTNRPLPNEPGPAEIANLRLLCERVLEPWRMEVGPLRVNSGYRSFAVNAAVGGSSTSEHLQGRAADVVPVRTALPMAWLELVGLVKEGLPVSQAIAYQRYEGDGWIHVGLDLSEPIRGQLLVQTPDGRYHRWEDWGDRPLVLG